MVKRCVICKEDIFEDGGKLKGTIIKVLDENKKRSLILVCSYCQKKPGWIEKAKIKGA